jgi:hypothetical protein
MKHIFFALLLGGLFAANGLAQTVAMDFTKDDCDGNSHTLFSDLDNGTVVIMEYIMGCTPCCTAAKNLQTIFADYETSHPGKVKCYLIADANQSCSYLSTWESSQKIAWPSFTGGSDEVKYYGGSGMPTIVIAAGKDHKIYYKKLGSITTELTKIRTAIDNAIAETSAASVKEDVSVKTFSLYPNPAKDVLNVNLVASQPNALLKIYDESGKEAMFVALGSSAATQIDVSSLSSGIYHITLASGSTVFASRQFSVQK